MRNLTLSLLALVGLLVGGGGLTAEPVGVEGEWPRWRGPFDNGMARGGAPVSWTDTENVKWKVDVPGKGHSSPVIWGDKLFLTTAVQVGEEPAGAEGGRGSGGSGGGEQSFLTLAYDRATGKKLWEREALRGTPHEGYHRQYGSFASHSPVTDGEVLISYFGSRGAFAYDLEGKLLWKYTELPQHQMRMQFGEGIAPVLDGDTVLLTVDHNGDPDFLLALDKSTGEEKWRTAREEISNWAAPLVIEADGKRQAIISAPTKVCSYDMATGKLIWEASGLGANTIPAPVSDGEMVWVMSGFRDPNLLAITLKGAKGDITGSDHIVWTNQKGNSYTPSPVLDEGILYFATDRGMISAFDAKTGAPHYHLERLPNPTSLKASLVGADGKLYVSTESGEVVVLKMGPEYEVLSVNAMGDEFFVASPAIADGKIYLRGRNTLYCVE